jgi:hypothetical protein
MAEHWLKALGGKLLDTGAAYLQQVRFVQELKGLPSEQARERFLSYVQNLSASARAGFLLTLTSLANNERQAEARRFLEMLRAALANPADWSAGSPSPQAAPEALQERGVPAADPFDEDLQRLDIWLALDDDARPDAVETYVAGLSGSALASFKANLEQAQSNVTQRIADHRENEARIAAGRFIEDQIDYRRLRLAGAAPDAGWLATLQEYETVQHFIEALHRFVAAVVEERGKPPPPAPVAPRRAEEAEEANDAKGGRVAGSSPQIQALRDMLEEELASGRVMADRAPAYRRTLAKIESVSEAHARGEIGPDVAEARMQELIADFMRYVADPGNTSARATPRGREVLRHAGALKANVLREFKNPPPAATADAIGAVLGDLSKFQTEAAEAQNDDTLAALEAELLRPAARAWHELSLTRHAMLARPLWESNDVMRSVNTLFYSGANDLQARLERVAEGKRLTVDSTRRLQNHGQLRWDALNACHVAVFDLRRASEVEALATRAPKRARELTGAAYELGLAFALGKPVVVLSSPGEVLPFDIDLSPVPIDGTDDDDDALAQALDEAFYVAQREGRGNSIPASVAHLDRMTQTHPRRASIQGMGWLNAGLKKDPAGFAAAARQVLREIDEPQWQVLRPAWPGAYPEPTQPRCFHVMPFGPPWADAVRDAARAACTALGLDYKRGDEAKDGRIVRAIWDDLCSASVVLVELHGGNLNVMIELGIANALGRPVLTVQRGGGYDLRPRHIEKLRFYSYETAEELSDLLHAHLTSPAMPPLPGSVDLPSPPGGL